MRKSTFASLASLVFSVSLALTGCQVGDEGDGGGGGGDPKPDAGGGGGGTPDAGGGNAQPCPPSEADFMSDVYTPVFKGTCDGCHKAGGVAGGTQLLLDESNPTSSLNAAKTVAAKKNQAGTSVLLVKPTGGGGHQGGSPVTQGDAKYQALEKFVGQINGTNCSN